MSGGSMDYLYAKVSDVAEELAASPDIKVGTFGRHLRNVAECLYRIEWWQSGDTDRESCEAALDAVVSPSVVLEEAVRRAVEARATLDDAIRAAGKEAPDA